MTNDVDHSDDDDDDNVFSFVAFLPSTCLDLTYGYFIAYHCIGLLSKSRARISW
jgi:hypothetical protein